LDGAGEPITHHQALVDMIGFMLSAQDSGSTIEICVGENLGFSLS
jgi:hypothetical protein